MSAFEEFHKRFGRCQANQSRSFVSSMALMTAGNGSRTSPEKLKPANDEWDATTAETGSKGRTEDCVNYMVRGLDRP
ncbi:hypothetical protein VSDG_07962 [Cytospora chrysosperma]|uniref:Uncharacterized protein n=1 Tax=Cytospora chrysosperma TaxID=252740 RepID=A0A423VKN7_CYTCH|nr:hypothetical protein VSDG_07962 [Valsa sordida]